MKLFCAHLQVGKTVQDDSKRGSDESAATESCDLPNNEMYRVDTHGDEMAVLPDSQLMGGNVSGKQFLARYAISEKFLEN